MKVKWVALGVAVVAITFLIFRGTKQGMVYYYTPSEFNSMSQLKPDQRMRVGGLVEQGSLMKEPGNLTIRFKVTDGEEVVEVEFNGTPPDLFKEGQGAVVEGYRAESGLFQADNIMVKHSEEYKPVYGDPHGYKPAFQPGGNSDG